MRLDGIFEIGSRKITRSVKRLYDGIGRRVPHGIKATYFRIQRFFPKTGTTYHILPGKTLRTLRDDVVRTAAGAAAMATTNCGLVATESGFMGIYKEGTFTSCWELGINLPTTTNRGVRQSLWLCQFDKACRLISTQPIFSDLFNGTDSLDESGILEDARLVNHNNEIIVVVNYVPFPDGPESFPDQRNAWPLIGVLREESAHITFNRLVLEETSRPQKNWIPFSAAGQLYLQYSMSPHRVLNVDPASGECADAWITAAPEDVCRPAGLKGGAPPVNLGEFMLGACHAWELDSNRERDYKTYFYLMKPSPPFQITRFSPAVKLLVPNRIQYLIGMVLGKDNRSIILSYGVCDCDNYFVKVALSDISCLIGL